MLACIVRPVYQVKIENFHTNICNVYVVCVSLKFSLHWERENTHTHTHTHIYIYIYIYMYMYINEGESKSNAFFFSRGIITDTGSYILHEKEAGICGSHPYFWT